MRYAFSMTKVRMCLSRHPLEMIQAVRYKIGKDRKHPLISWIEKNHPETILEIGVFNGHFASRMLTRATSYSRNVSYTGIDLFMELQSVRNYHAEASLWPDSRIKVLSLLKRDFPNTEINLLQGYSHEILPSLSDLKFDLIFIDGGHAYETVKSDWTHCKELLANNGAIFFDDYTNRNGIKSGFGVNRLIDEIDSTKFSIKRYFNRDFFKHEYGWLITRLVRVQKKNELHVE